jgi:hypothetical protein
MATLDWIILILFLGSLLGIVWWVKHKTDDIRDYFLSGRSGTWLAFGAAIFAANIGSEHLVRCWCRKRLGNGSLGNVRLDDSRSGLGYCTLLCS